MKTTFLGKYYYWIWADGIMKAKERFPDSNIYWKFMLMLSMVVSCGIFTMIFYGFISRMIGLPWPQLNLSIDFWNNLLSALVFFYLPWFLIHYYLVFWKDKYQSFLPKYEYRKGKLFTNFFLGIIFIPLFLLIIGVIIAKMLAN